MLMCSMSTQWSRSGLFLDWPTSNQKHKTSSAFYIENRTPQQTTDCVENVFVFIEIFEKEALIYLAVVMHTTHSTLMILLNVNI